MTRESHALRGAGADLFETSEELRWRYVEASEFERYYGIWNALNDAGARSPLLDAAFMQIGLRYFGAGDEKIALCTRGNEPLAMALFKPCRFGKMDLFQPSQLPLGPLVAGAETSLADIVDSLTDDLPLRCMMISLTQLDPLHFNCADAMKGARILPHLETGFIDIPADAEAYRQSRPKKKVTQVDKRIEKAAAQFGSVHFELCGETRRVEELVGLFADMESAGWKGAAGSALRRGAEQERFYAAALEHFAGRGEMRIFCLFFGRRLAAMQIAVLRDRCLYLLKSSYDETLKDYSPGVALKKLMVEHLLDNEASVRRVEFYGKLIEPHRTWVTGSREIFHANIYRAPLVARMHDMMRGRGQPDQARAQEPV
jgi:hypothetical protein